jgi:CheY-like chemotaxis protein
MALKIMVMDSEPASSKLLRSLSAPFGHVVLTFDDLQAAGQRAEGQRFDVAFVGMRATNLAELELVRQIRNSQPNREAIIVMLTDTEDVPTLRKAFGEGADFVLTQPMAGNRLRRMLAAMDSMEWKKRGAARMPLFTEVVCTWNGRQLPMRSRNISESGMLLQGPLDTELSEEVRLEFHIAELGASLKVSARTVRKEGADRIAVGFVTLEPEDRNAIQLYVMGRLKDLTPPRDLAGVGLRRVFRT